MSISIPAFQQRISLLNQLLETAHACAGRSTERSIKNIAFSDLSWGEEHERVYLDLQESLHNVVKLSHPDPPKSICIHTDASEKFWSGIVTQLDDSELAKHPAQQWHAPLAIVGGECKKHDLDWSTLEKEGFATF